MYKVKDIAEWFVQRASADVNKGGDYLTQLKLQKLLYYAQGFYMAFNDGEKLFKEKIIHLPYGPVVQSLIPILKPFSNNPIYSLKFNIPEIDEQTLAILNVVYKNLGQFSAYKLVELTHSETPWQNTKQGEEINPKDICQYIKEHYIKEENINQKESYLYTYDDVWKGLECACEKLKIIIDTFASVFGVDSSYCTPEYFIKQGVKNKK